MLKILSLLLAFVTPASAQQANFNYLGTEFSQTVTNGNVSIVSTTGIAATFANVVTGQSGRQSCWIQYKPGNGIPANAATEQGAVFFGVAAPTTLTSAFILNSFQILDCEAAAEVEGSGIWISGSATGDVFTIKVK